ncbi:MAG: 5-oxoprolinase subunit PxpB [Clostridia bacterium]|nr:5-oxoprolinase subunit PxpB [Clostridia bacterium]MBQ7087686.1 5-oxoprolinase subunit PxpB [Clostridia bacterium]
MDVRYLPLGDTGLTVEFGNEISPAINSRVTRLCDMLKTLNVNGIVETMPTYRSVSIYYDPSVLDLESLTALIDELLSTEIALNVTNPYVIEIPVWYSSESGPDLEFVASHNGKTVDEVIAIHSSPEYLIYMIGFTPGFPYLGGMDNSIATPRLDNPRVKIEAGSVGIAGSQTGIYSVDSPGGWRLIGKTPVKLFDMERENPVLLKSGNYLKFVPISKEEYFKIKEQADKGIYLCKMRERGV